jgi:hypothetical protein
MQQIGLAGLSSSGRLPGQCDFTVSTPRVHSNDFGGIHRRQRPRPKIAAAKKNQNHDNDDQESGGVHAAPLNVGLGTRCQINTQWPSAPHESERRRISETAYPMASSARPSPALVLLQSCFALAGLLSGLSQILAP